MGDVTIHVEGLSKRYYLGERKAYGSLRESLVRAAGAPFRRIARRSEPARNEPFWALEDVSFDVRPGEAVGIIGRNGAGKSTLLKILSRITKPTRGQAAIYGRLSSLLEVGTGFHPELTGRENIFLNGAILGMSRNEIAARFDEIVDFAETERFLDTPLKRYSSGMYLRLAFSVAAHLEPEILLVDEVLAVGDTVFQQKCLGKMGEISHSGRTILFVSHNLHAIMELCSRGILIDRGHLVADGDVRQVVDTYLSAKDGGPTDAVDLSTAEFPHWQRTTRGELRLQRCALYNSEGRPSARFKFGEPFTVYMEATSTRQFDMIGLGFYIYTHTGVMVALVWNKDQHCPFSIGPDRPLKVSIDVDQLELLPGNYSITPFVETGQYAADIIHQLLQFEISELGYDESASIPKYGLIKARSTWREGERE